MKRSLDATWWFVTVGAAVAVAFWVLSFRLPLYLDEQREHRILKRLKVDRREKRTLRKLAALEGAHHTSEFTHYSPSDSICRPSARVTVLRLDNTAVRDAHLVDLVHLPELRTVYVDYSDITDTGLAHLARIGRLKGLSLGGTAITDAGMRALPRLAQLEYLDLSYTRVTDAGLAHLTKLSKLQQLILYGTQVTDAGVQALRRSLPSVEITR